MNVGLFSRSHHLRKFVLFFSFLFITTFAISFAETITYTDSSGLNPRSAPPYTNGYVVHTFTDVGSSNFILLYTGTTSIDYLVVGGGGGGTGAPDGGGGGAGKFVYITGYSVLTSSSSIPVVVGAGGSRGSNGESSSFGGTMATGGGAGIPELTGGTSGQGYGGGGGWNNFDGHYSYGGGGGSSGAGSNPDGGTGSSTSISGVLTYYAGGGGGYSTEVNGIGQARGGSGWGGVLYANASSSSGSGGGYPGAGGSGIVIIRHLYTHPIISSATATSITETSALLGGTLDYTGNSAITARGICYGATSSPTNCVAEGGTATGTFSMFLTGLATSTTYYYRGYATNASGTAYTSDATFTTEGITNSLMFDSASSQYLSRTQSAGNRKTWTLSTWVKRSKLASRQVIMDIGTASSDTTTLQLEFNSSDQLTFGGGVTYWRVSNAVFRDPSTWYHITVAVDTTQSTASDRIKVYVNGSEETSWATNNAIGSSADTALNITATVAYIVNNPNAGGQTLDGYLSDVNFIDGQALTPSYFGKTDSNTGNWVPKAYQGTYGVNGFRLNFSSSTALGYDTAPIDSTHTATNTWTTNGGMSSTTNQYIDTPFNNFATLNPLQKSSSLSLTKGNLTSSLGGGYYNIYGVMASMPIKDFDTYFEAKLNNTTRTISSSQVGVVDWDIETNRNIFQTSGGSGSDAAAVIAHGGGDYIKIPGSSTSDGVSYTTSDTIMVAVSPSLRKVWFGKNGTWNNGSNPVTNSGGHTFASSGVTGYFPIFRVNPDAETESATLNFGQKSFAYTPPTGFKSLSTANLPTPTILKPNEHFDVITRSGFDTSGGVISGLSFQPDFVWDKSRNNAGSNYLFDSVRGVGKYLHTNSTGVETTNTNVLSSFNSDGFAMGTLDWPSSYTVVDWLWKGGNATTTNTSGTISSVVSTNPTAGFSIVSYTGNATAAQTIGHGLGAEPVFMIIKSRGTQVWNVYHKLGGATNNTILELDSTAALNTGSNITIAASTTTFGVGSAAQVNGSGVGFVAYTFAEVPGYSKFGTYTGNASSDGPFMYTGFKPRWIMIKSTASADWVIEDTSRSPYNVSTNYIVPNSSAAETTGQLIDVLSNGFKIRSAVSSAMNDNGTVYTYVAFAESILQPTIPSLPTLSSPTATSTTETTAVIGGTVDTIGSSNITARGVCYGSTPAPITNCTAGTGTTTGVFTVSITGLATSTTCYYRAYATNAVGTAYSTDSTFTTSSLTNSLMFDSAQSQYLNRTFSTPTDNKKFTWSGWVKRSKLTSGYPALFAAPGTTDELIFDINDHLQYYNNAAVSSNLNTTQVFRDPSAWYHIVLAVDTTQAVSSDRVKIFSNGTQIASFSSANYPALNYSQGFNSAISHQVAKATGAHYYDGYLSDVNFIDGQQLTPASFGETSSSTGNWIPKKYIGSYGNNGFRLNFSNSNQVGADSSGNSNNWASNGGITSTNNQVTDTPLNNFATLNALTLSAGTLSLGNLRFSALTANSQTKLGTIGVSSGKWYWETNIGAVSVGTDVGISPASLSTYANGYFPGSDSLSYSYDQNGQKYTSNSGTAYGSTYTNGDVIGTALDMDAGTLTFYKNGVSQGVAFSSLSGVFVPAMASYGGGNYFTANFGQKSFTYTPPEGFKSLSTANLSTPGNFKT